jgi:cephalosporin hydroxylase
MPVRVNGIEAKQITAEMKAVHQFVSTGAYAVTLDTAREHGVNSRKSLAHAKQVVSNR